MWLVTIAVTACGGGSDHRDVTTPVAAALATASVTPGTVEAPADSALALAAAARTSAGAAVGDASYTWARSGTAGGTLTAQGAAATYRGGTPGVDTIVVTAASGGRTTTALAVVTVRGPRVAVVAFPARVAYVGVGGTLALPAVGRDAAGASNARATLAYRAEPAGVVAVDADGTLTGRAAGTARLVAVAQTTGASTTWPADTLRVVVAGAASDLALGVSDTVLAAGRTLTVVGPDVGPATSASVNGTSAPVSAGLGGAVVVTPPPNVFATCRPLGTSASVTVTSGGKTRALAVGLYAPQVVSLTPGQDVALTAAAAAGCPVAVDQAGTYVVMPFAWDRGLANGGTAGSPSPSGVTTTLSVRAGGVGQLPSASRAFAGAPAPFVRSGTPTRPIASDVIVPTPVGRAHSSAAGPRRATYPSTWSGGSCPIPTVVGDTMPVGTLRDSRGSFLQTAATSTYGGSGVSEPWTLAAIGPSVAVFFDTALVHAKASMPGADARAQLFAASYDSTVTPLLREITDGVPDADGNGRVVVLVALHAGSAYAYPTGYARSDCAANGFVLGEAINLGGDAFVAADNLVAQAVSVAAHETGHVVDNAQRYMQAPYQPAIRQDTWWSREGYAVLVQHLWSLAGANGGHVPADAFTGNRSAAAYRTIGGTAQGGFCERPERAILTTWYTLSANGYPLACQATRYLLGQLATQQPGLTPRDLMVRWSQLRDRRHFVDAAAGLWGIGTNASAATSAASTTGDWYLSWVADGIAGTRAALQDPAANLRSLYRVWWPQNTYPAPVAALGLGASLAVTLGEPDAAPIQLDLPARGWVAITGTSGGSVAVPTDRVDVRLLRVR